MIISMMIPLFHDFGNERILNSIISITRLSFLPYPLNEKDSTIQNIRMKCKIEINSMIISMILLSYDFGRARDRKSSKRKIRFELETILHNNYRKWCELRVQEIWRLDRYLPRIVLSSPLVTYIFYDFLPMEQGLGRQVRSKFEHNTPLLYAW